MKKLLSMLLAVLLLTSLLAGCASAPAAQAPAAEDAPAAQAPAAQDAPAAEAPAAEAPAAEVPAAAEDEVVRLTLGTTQAVDNPISMAMVRLSEEVAAETNGTLVIDVFPANQLGPEADMATAMVNGAQDMLVMATGEMAKRVPQYGICDAPYVFNSPEHMLSVIKGEIFQEFNDELLNEHGIRTIAPVYLGTRQLTSTDKPINTPEDLEGFKIRVPDQPPSVEGWKCLGTNPTPIDFSELYMALQQGVCDGQENSFAQIIGNKLYEVQSYCTLTGHTVQHLWISISELTWQKLSEEHREVLTEVSEKISAEVIEEMIQLEQGEQLQTLVDAGLEIIEVDQDAFRQVALSNLPNSGYFDMELYNAIQAAG